MKITTIINYCTNDYRFINKCINSVIPFSNQVIIPVSDHFFDGTPENRELLEKTYKENPTVEFIEYEWSKGFQNQYWVIMARIIGMNSVKEDSDWILFLDSDEIIDTESFIKLIPTIENYDSIKLGCYYYFREPIYRAKSFEDSIVLVKKNLVDINPNLKEDREQMHEMLTTQNKKRMVLYNNTPTIHHYSWVRTKEEMLKKVNTWGHNKDRNWVSLVEEEFSRPFNGKDFIHGYQYDTVENTYNL